MDGSSFIDYLVAGAMTLLFGLVLLSLLRRRRARGPMLVNNPSPPGEPPVLTPPARKSMLGLGRELLPEVERLLGSGDRAGAVRLVRERAGLGVAEAEQVVSMVEKFL